MMPKEKEAPSNTIAVDLDRIRHLEYLEQNEQGILNHALEKYKATKEKTANKRKTKQTTIVNGNGP